MTAVTPPPPARRPNLQLARLLAESGLSRRAFARRVGASLAADGMPCPAMGGTYVSRWLAGMQPRPRTATHIVGVLGRALGREVTPTEAGFFAPTVERVPLADTSDYRVPLAAADLLAELESLRWQVDRLASMLTGAAA